jgi:uncharacterized protein (TIGR02391 family)
MEEDKIEQQRLLAESGPGGYHNVRLTWIKYKNNPSPCIDIRIFQRGYDADGEEEYNPTKKGVQMLESDFQRIISEWRLIPEKLLHPKILLRAYKLFLSGEYESAVLQAFKVVEVEVRRVAKLGLDDVGTKLMRKAFDSERGPLTDKRLPIAEREAIAHLFAGGIGLYKNPCSHRHVEMDYHEAFEKLNLASHLLKLIDSVRIMHQGVS